MAIFESPSACIAADRDSIAKIVLMPGDPLRAKMAAETYLESPVLFNSVRNMLGYTGVYKGRCVSIMGSGMGIPSATLYAHELFEYFGVEAIIRIGTAGGIGEGVELRDLVAAMTASTNSSFSAQYGFPGLLAPCADFKLLSLAMAAGRNLGVNMRAGAVFTGDMYYNADRAADEKFRDMGILAVDMETAGLYWEAMACKKRCLSLLSVSNMIFTGEGLTAGERQTGFGKMIETALETAVGFYETEEKR